ncbi:MAG: hypothetical protein HUU54_03730 [Ignavibacteriaceae bacterium]|nr:hypothetical protein [Ignavibacteriaceae bacterium]
MSQSLLTIAAMMLLTTLAIRVNSTVLMSQETSQNSKFGLAAISLATSEIEEASRLAFDENSNDNPLTSVNSLTNVSALGKESGETNPSNFDDLDDYHNYSYTDSTQISAVFRVWFSVNYVNTASLNSVSSSKTWHKRITVNVASPSMRDTVRFSSVFSYWVFR